MLEGTLVVLGGVVAHALGSPAGRDEAVSGAVLIFFAGALAAVVLARLRLEHEREPGSGWVRRRWLSAVLLPVVAVLAVAVLAVGVFTRDLLDTVIWAVAPLVWGSASSCGWWWSPSSRSALSWCRRSSGSLTAANDARSCLS